MIKPKVVFDTNIYLSAIIFGGNPRKVLQLAIDEKILLYSSTEILLEVALKLKGKFKWSAKQINFTIKNIGNLAKIVRIKEKIDFIKKDPTDNKILEAAIESKAGFIITGDSHLLELKSYKRIKIIKATELLEYFKTVNS